MTENTPGLPRCGHLRWLVSTEASTGETPRLIGSHAYHCLRPKDAHSAHLGVDEEGNFYSWEATPDRSWETVAWRFE